MKKLICLALALALIFSLAACGGDTKDNHEATTPPAADTGAPNTADDTGSSESNDGPKVFVYGADANSSTFDPYADLQTKSGMFFVQACGETLWTMDADGNMIPKLAKSAEWTDDLTLTIKLREGVKYSNGNDFTADDVIYSLTLMSTTGRTESMLQAVDFEKTKIVDDYTIELAFTTYDAAFIDTLGNASFCMLDKEYCESRGDFGWFVGTGPYRLAGDGESDKSGWVESVEYRLVRNEYYWGEAPYYDELICKFYSEEATRYSDLVAGNLDAAIFSESTYINNLGKGAVADCVLVQKKLPSVFGFTLAVGEGSNMALSDINIRKAMAHALDINAIVESLGEGVYSVADSILTDSNWAYHKVGVYEYDPEYAAQCLAEAGYSTSNPLTIRLVAESSAFNSAVAEAAQAYLAEIGIKLDLSGMGDFSTILPRLIAGDMEASIGTPSNGSGNDPASLLQQMGPASHNGLQRVTDPELVELFNAGSSSRDNNERIEIYKEFQQKVHDKYWNIPLWVDSLNYGVNAKHSSFESALDVNCQLNPCLLTD
ncbi:MAG: ABC transporter substrate-binding protein [Oscillospiraceae bacterium]|jgi:peptide/nickel transport system substrate-binding protein